MNQIPYRVTYFSLDDTWCRYFTSHNAAVRFMQEQQAAGYRVELTHVPEI